MNNGQYDSWEKIKDENFWDSIGETPHHPDLSEKPLYVETNNPQSDNGKVILLSDREESLQIIADYIKNKYDIIILNLLDNWCESYKKIKESTRWLIFNKHDAVSQDEVCNKIKNLCDIESLSEEKKIWLELRKEKKKLLKNKAVHYYNKDNNAKFLDDKYAGICQICGKYTVTGKDKAHYWRYRLVKTKNNKLLSNMYSNVFCLCPNCHGELEYGYLERDLTKIGKTSQEYYDEFIKTEKDEIEDGEPTISYFASQEESENPFKNPVICDIMVNGEKRKIRFSWEHFIRLAFLLCDKEE